MSAPVLAGNAGLNPAIAGDLLSRVEDAGLNASAPPQQRWLDGWLVRFSPGKARRARCVHAVAEGRLPLAHKLAQAQAVFDEAQLPLVVRITPFTQPKDLDAQLGERGFSAIDDTGTDLTIRELGYPNAEIVEVSRTGMEQCLDKMATSVAAT